jgi:hypothetical protein
VAQATVWQPINDLLCPALTPVSGIEDICFPGGLCLSALFDPGNYPRVSDLVMAQLQQVGPAMAPLKPFFDVLDTALAIFRCIESIPDCITQLDPSGLINCIPDLAEKINQLLSLVPQLTIPRLVAGLIRNLAAFLRAFADDLAYLQVRLARIAQAVSRAADLSDVTWGGFLTCAEATVQDELDALAIALRGIGRIILLANILLSLVGGAPEIPCFGTMLQDADALGPVITAMRALATLLDQIAALIPDPQYAITAALKGTVC